MNYEIFNNSLSLSVDVGTTYYDFNKYILQAGADTAITNNKKNRLWSHFRHDSFLPLIYKRYAILSDYHTLGIIKGESSEANI